MFFKYLKINTKRKTKKVYEKLHKKAVFFLLLLIYYCSSKKIVSTSLNNPSLKTPKSQKIIMRSLNTSVEKIVNAGGNKKREKSIVKRIKELELSQYTKTENIDWLSVQKNILINIKG
ncbi:hypothetical protein N9Y27_02910 [Flavobacteriaceae bacterium]|nr:hypothetical protein [Flavobacteriaceae bacterium]